MSFHIFKYVHLATEQSHCSTALGVVLVFGGNGTRRGNERPLGTTAPEVCAHLDPSPDNVTFFFFF